MLDATTLDAHLDRLRTPAPPLELVRPCTVGDGIAPLDPEPDGSDTAAHVAPLRFVPASGAATRMFGSLRRVRADDLDSLRAQADTDPSLRPALRALSRWDELALSRALPDTDPASDLPAALHTLHASRWPDRPKGLVPFHLHGHEWRSAIEGHLREAARAPLPRVHLTAPTAHLDAFRQAVARAAARVRVDLGVSIDVTLSIQHPHTDTPAIDAQGELVTDADGAPLLRPGGHGALLRNLDALSGFVRILNVDNIAHADHRDALAPWGRALVREAHRLQAHRDTLIRTVRAGGELEAARAWLEGFGWTGPTSRAEVLADLDRPVRVCGVVPNEGQPGGGPFWVRHNDGRVTAQIVEGIEVSRDREDQRAIWEASTHFNPVDLVCVLDDVDGEPYDLTRFVDDTRWIHTRKRHGGAMARCLERPGLWNGSMSGWLTRFVALPRETFNPVKTVADLLDERHRPHP